MALTKVTKSGITDNSIDADKIEDGTIVAADIADGTITSAKLTGSIANNKLANSSITVNGTSVSLGGSVSAGSIEWQSVITADGSTTTSAVAGQGYFIDTTSNSHTITLPASPSIGDTIAIKDYAGTYATNALTIARNGKNIQGVANNSEISTARASVVLVFIDDTKGWLFTNESNVADLQEVLFTIATGGTVTTSGNFKIHSFTGDGCFAVSTVGNSVGGGGNVDYLVVAGGGGSGGGGAGYNRTSGGGGAGGYRTTFPSPGCNAGAFPITSITYPITVGGGGSGGAINSNEVGVQGSPSIFSTITSTGGGLGASQSTGSAGSGGSGGGLGGFSGPLPGGAGNTPPVSPPQGNPGGGAPFAENAGGGGGIGGSGTNGTGNNGGSGGSGTTNSITGSPVAYAGGGAGAGISSNGSPGGSGGGAAGSSGAANTGGGGGAALSRPDGGKAGGSGKVLIRYKFQ